MSGPVTLALDATYAADPAKTGTGVYSRNLISSLAELAPLRDHSKYRLLLCFRPGPYLRRSWKEIWPAGCGISPLWEPWLWPRRARLFHGLNQRLPKANFPVRIVTIHDLFPMTSPDYSTREFQRRFSEIIRTAVRRADRIIAVSEATRQQLLRYTEARAERIRVVHHGVAPALPPTQTERDAFRDRVLGLAKGERFFLNVGTIQTRKNVASLVLALKELPNYQLVLAGGDGYGAEQVHALIEKEGMAARVLRLGHSSPETLRLLYSTATAMVFPSFEEGFGLPILEAMSYGLPVVTSNCSAMPEVAGDAALYVDPNNVSEIREAMRRVAEEEELASDLRRRGRQRAGLFSWEKCARETWAIYEEVLREVGGGSVS